MCKSQSGISSPKGMCISENNKSKNEWKKEKKEDRQTERRQYGRVMENTSREMCHGKQIYWRGKLIQLSSQPFISWTFQWNESPLVTVSPISRIHIVNPLYWIWIGPEILFPLRNQTKVRVYHFSDSTVRSWNSSFWKYQSLYQSERAHVNISCCCWLSKKSPPSDQLYAKFPFEFMHVLDI